MKKALLIIIALIISSCPLFAQQFSVANQEGVQVHYRVLSEANKTVAVSFGKEFGSYTEKVKIPSSVFYNNQNYTVTAIEIYAFYLCKGLTAVEIPNTVTTIGENSFANCDNLTSVNIPNSVTTIGEQAFTDCGALTTLDIPNSVVSIGEKAFSNCTKLKRFTLPTTLTSIRDGLFKGCSELSTMVIPQSVTTIGVSAFAGCTNLESVTIPNSVKIIQGSAFAGCSSLRSISIPNSVTTIEGSAFAGCSELRSAQLPNTISSIAASTFSGCSALSEVTIPASVQTIGINAFSGTSITAITIPNSVYVIDDNAFMGCSRLTSIVIPNSVTTIGKNAFAECSRLSSITIGENVTSIGASAFSNIMYINNLKWNARNVTYYPNGQFSNDYQNPFYKSGINHVSWGENVQSIPAYAFHCEMPNQYGNFDPLPKSVATIGEYAFYNCSGINTLNIGNTRASDISVYEIGAYAFAGCKDLSKITIGKAITSIKESAFENCTKLTSVNTGDSVQLIGKNAFAGCTSIRDLSIGTSVRTIEDGAFKNIKKLTSIKWDARDAENINGSNPFEGCTGLTNLTIGYWAQSLPNYLFSEGPNLTNLIVLAPTPPTVEAHAFQNMSSKTAVFVPCNSVTLYQTHIYWKRFLYTQGIGQCQHQMMVLASNNQGGTVSGSGKYKDGATATAQAIPNDGFMFTGWNDGNTENPRQIAITRDTLLIANFESGNAAVAPQTQCELTVTINNNKMGAAMGQGSYPKGTITQIEAVPNIGYRFVRWNDGNTQNPRSITVNDNQVYVAEFTTIRMAPTNNETPVVTLQTPTQSQYNNTNSNANYELNLVSIDNTLGTVVGSGNYPAGCVISIVAMPTTGNKFVKWNDGSTENPRQIRVVQNATYVAVFDHAGIEGSYLSGGDRNDLNVKYDERTGKTTILTEKVKSVKIYNSQGKKIAQYGGVRLIDFNSFASDRYTLLIELPEGIVIRKVTKK